MGAGARPARTGRRAGAAAAVAAAVVLTLGAAAPVQAQLFSDSEARKAILDLREKGKADQEQVQRQIGDLDTQLAALRRSLLELNSQLAQTREEMAVLRGTNEELRRDIADLQRLVKDANQSVDDRLRKLEPQAVNLDGAQFSATPQERQAYDQAIALLREGNFDAAATALARFDAEHPRSGYAASARFWLGNALYGKRDYKGAVAAFRSMVDAHPQHPKAPEALLALANSQAETKDTRAARRTLDELIKTYPPSEAAAAGKERLAALK
jgi:tol-pal system protein YbgF